MDFTKVENDGELHSQDYTILAVISNVTCPPEKPEYIVNLQTTDLSEHDFLQLFFNYSTNHFNINSANTFSKLISLKDKRFVSSANQLVPFNFVQLVLSKLAEKNSLTDNSINALKKLTAQKLAGQINSLAQVRGFQKALTWYETIDLLISSNAIAVSSNPLAVANSLLTVQFIFVEPSSNLSLAINYNYNVSIPGYSNLNSGPFTYSLDENYAKKLNYDFNHDIDIDNDVDNESIDYSITNSIVQQIKLIQTSSSNGSVTESMHESVYENVSMSEYEESIDYSINSSIMKQIQFIQQSSSSDCDTEYTNDDADTWS